MQPISQSVTTFVTTFKLLVLWFNIVKWFRFVCMFNNICDIQYNRNAETGDLTLVSVLSIGVRDIVHEAEPFLPEKTEKMPDFPVTCLRNWFFPTIGAPAP